MSLLEFNTDNIKSLDDEALHRLQTLIVEKTVTKSAAADYFKLDRKRFGEFMDKKGFALPKGTPGRPEKTIDPKTKKLIIDSHSKYAQGSTKTYFQLIADIESACTYNGTHQNIENLNHIPTPIIPPPTYNDICKVFKSENLYSYTKVDHPPAGKTNYNADYTNMIWHVDIHFLEHKKSNPFYSLIDDYSRFIVGYAELSDCCAATCLTVLIDAIDKYGKPFAIWSDNGSETKEVYHQYLMDNQIVHIRTRPRTPEQNGKIERFWGTLEKNYPNKELDKIIQLYNNSPHLSLPIKHTNIMGKTYRRNKTPYEAYFDREHRWNKTIMPTWTVDGQVKRFYYNNWVLLN